jgi:hypothetical protein
MHIETKPEEKAPRHEAVWMANDCPGGKEEAIRKSIARI